MVKYSTKENSYREMYLINKSEKDIMENSLQNLRNNKKDLIDKSVAANILLLPCHHISTCISCTLCTKFCPICRCKIETVIKVHFA